MNTDNNVAADSANEAPPTEGGLADYSAETTVFIPAEELAELRSKAAKADENWDKYVRLTADLDNFKKRAARERSEAIRYANEGLLEKLLPIVDNFEAALAAANASAENVHSLRQGIQMINSQLKSYLNEAGVDEIDALNQPFDPNFHEAVSEQAAEGAPAGQVIQQMRKGYKFRDRVIRPAMVVVAK